MSAAAIPVALAAYGLTAAAYSALSAQLLVRARRSPRAQLLLCASALSVLWALCGAAFAVRPGAELLLAQQLADAARIGAWGLFLAALLPEASSVRGPLLLAPRRAGIALGAGVVLALASVTVYLQLRQQAPGESPGAAVLLYALWVCTAILGLSVCEQLFRQTPSERRWAVKPLCLGLAAICVFDLFVFSQAMLLRQLDPQMLSVRGLAHAIPIPLVMLATARNGQWTIDLGVSRSVVVGSLALLLSGAYLLAVAGAGYVVRLAGGDWGRAIQVTFLLGAALVLALLFFSGTLRSWLRVFVSKHFFSYRYDYREEWLKFTARLASAEDAAPIAARTIAALADLVESPGGTLWLRREDGRLAPAARWNMAEVVRAELEPGDALAAFLTRTGWILELHGKHPPDLRIPEALARIPDAWLLVPLPARDALLGFVVLLRSRTPVEINWEVRGLLKTAARQAAAFLGHVRSAEALAEARQFDAYNRMSAFVVHDLKNLVAQLSLMLRNAERHAANPVFQRDMLETVEHAVERMNRLLLQLRSGATPVEKPAPVELARVMQRVHAAHAGQSRSIELELEPGLRALGHEERLIRVVGHLVQNAIDASSEGGRVLVRAGREADCAVIEVRDEGQGMTEAFVREHLFKPFRTTKPSGMGIGAYESQQYVAELGGRIAVESAPGRGTQVRVHLPLAEAAQGAQSLQQAAA